MSTTGKKLMEFYAAMVKRFGHQQWWPGDTPLEICIGAVLTQNTNWRNVEKAIANLKAAGFMNVTALLETPREKLAELIRPAGYFNVKAKRLRNLLKCIHESHGDDVEEFLNRSVNSLREELLSINGIGRETADSIILYAAHKPSFVVDTYTYRILLRHGMIYEDDGYDAIKELFESSLDEDVELWNDYHAQLVAVGKNYCKPNAKCDGCPLETFEHDPLAGTHD